MQMSHNARKNAPSDMWNCAVLSKSSAYWKAKDVKFLHADNKDSDQTAQMRSLISVIVGRTC